VDEAGGLMAKVDLPYVQRFRDRYGKVRHYFRRAGSPRLALPGEPMSREFLAAYHTALAKQEKRPVGADQTKPGTLGALLVEFYTSTEWANLKPVTQANYRNIYERFRADYGHNMVAALTKKNVQAMMAEKVATPGAARNFLKRLRGLLDFAVDRDYRDDNPAKAVKAPRTASGGFRAWTDEDIQRFTEHHPAGSRARLALLLLLYTGQRRSDVVTMGRQHVANGKIHVLQLKGKKDAARVRLAIPIHPELKAALDILPKDNLAFLVTVFGKPMTAAGFTQWFGEMAQAAGLPARSSPHGLRKASARRLAEAGCTAHQIAAITGHRSLDEVEHYTRSADQSRLAESAMKALERDKRGTGRVKP
jgi:integrase